MKKFFSKILSAFEKKPVEPPGLRTPPITADDVRKAGMDAAYETRLQSKTAFWKKPNAGPMQFTPSAMTAMNEMLQKEGAPKISNPTLTGWAGLASKRAEMGKIQFAIKEGPLSPAFQAVGFTGKATASVGKFALKSPLLLGGGAVLASYVTGVDPIQSHVSDSARPGYDTVKSAVFGGIKFAQDTITGVASNGITPTFNKVGNDLTYLGLDPSLSRGAVTVGTFLATKKGLDVAASISGLDKKIPAAGLVTTFAAGAAAMKAYNATDPSTVSSGPQQNEAVRRDPRLMFAPD